MWPHQVLSRSVGMWKRGMMCLGGGKIRWGWACFHPQCMAVASTDPISKDHQQSFWLANSRIPWACHSWWRKTWARPLPIWMPLVLGLRGSDRLFL